MKMLLCKFNLLSILLFLISSSGFALFSDNDCLQSNYSIKVKHKGQPFGLMENILSIDKKKCVMNIQTEKLKFLKKKWIIDVCRAPVHIKEGAGAVDVYRKKNTCTSRMLEGNSKDDYCVSFYNLIQMLQDYGLIFADGAKEDLSSDHGKVNCAYILINKYLDNDMVLGPDIVSTPLVEVQDIQTDGVKEPKY